MKNLELNMYVQNSTSGYDKLLTAYDNTTSGLTATNTQSAIDEINDNLANMNTAIDTLNGRINIPITNVGSIVTNTYSCAYKKGAIGVLNLDIYYTADAQYTKYVIFETGFRPSSNVLLTVPNNTGDLINLKIDTYGIVYAYTRDSKVAIENNIRCQIIVDN